jgi:hypothetical protein
VYAPLLAKLAFTLAENRVDLGSMSETAILRQLTPVQCLHTLPAKSIMLTILLTI